MHQPESVGPGFEQGRTLSRQPYLSDTERGTIMFNLKHVIFGERSVTKVAGLYNSNEAARVAAQNLVENSPLSPSQVRVVGPADTVPTYNTGISRAIEPESQGIWHTLIKSHLAAGLAGLFAGLVLLGVFIVAGNQAVVSSLFLSLVSFAGFGLVFGLLVGGALSMRPDHGHVVSVVRQGLKEGQWAVIVHPVNADQTHEAVKVLETGSDKLVRTL